MPYCFISLGPTGVGKSTSVKYQINRLNLDPNYINLNIDRCVTSSKEYISFVDSIIEEYPDILDRLRESNIIRRFEEKYFEVRSEVCNEKFEEEMRHYLKQKENVVMEFTGVNDINWIFELYHKELKRYNIIFNWTVANICEIISRNIERTQNDMEDYMMGMSKDPPRLTYKSKPDFIRNIRKIMTNINLHVKDINKTKNVRVIITNNIKDGKPVIVYDSKVDLTKQANVRKIFDISSRCLVN